MNDVSLEGDITVPGAPREEEEETEFNTLDEPVRDTVVSLSNFFIIAIIVIIYSFLYFYIAVIIIIIIIIIISVTAIVYIPVHNGDGY